MPKAKNKAPAQGVTPEPKPTSEGVTVLTGEGKALRQKWEDKQIRALEDEIYEESMSVVRDALRFKEIDPQGEAPVTWTKEQERVARAAWLTQSEAPVGLSMARAVALAISKARSERDVPRPLNVAVQMVLVPPTFPRKRLDQ